jgi:hypothetical protein
VLEALLEYELAGESSAAVTQPRLRGQEYLLERHLFHRLSTGEVIEHDRDGGSAFTRFAFPTWWHYDVLRGLEYLRRAGATPDERAAEAITLVESKRDRDGRWPLEVRYPGPMPVEIDEGEGRPSRWEHTARLASLGLVFDTRLTQTSCPPPTQFSARMLSESRGFVPKPGTPRRARIRADPLP